MAQNCCNTYTNKLKQTQKHTHTPCLHKLSLTEYTNKWRWYCNISIRCSCYLFRMLVINTLQFTRVNFWLRSLGYFYKSGSHKNRKLFLNNFTSPHTHNTLICIALWSMKRRKHAFSSVPWQYFSYIDNYTDAIECMPCAVAHITLLWCFMEYIKILTFTSNVVRGVYTCNRIVQI